MSTTPLLVVVDQPPFSGAAVRERVDLVIMALALELPLQLLFVGDGVWQLLEGQLADTIDAHDSTAAWRSLDLYGLEEVLVHRGSLLTRGLDTDQLMVPVTEIDDRAVSDILNQSGQCL